MSGHPVVIVGFDGLRPDFVRPELTPNLHAFAAQGVRFARHRSVFPSETRVALTSLGSGAWPTTHGIVGNKYHDRTAAPDTWLDSGNTNALETAYPNGPTQSGSLGRTLHRAGRRLAVIGTGSAGATRLLSPHAPELGLLSLICRNLPASCPADEVASIVDRFGAPPAHTLPDTTVLDWATTVFIEHVWPALRPDVTVLWFLEPDTSAHYLGLGADGTREALRAADAAFGRLLDWWHARPEVRLIALSDHGHIAQTEPVSAATSLAGFGLAAAPGAHDAPGYLLPGHVGRIYLRRPDPGLLDALAEMLMAQPWCGHLLARDHFVPPGCLPLSVLQADHERAPHLTYTLRSDDMETAPGLPGRVPFDGEIGPGAGYHGGLQRHELDSLLIMAGEGLRQGVMRSPSGIVDIAPTVLHWLGLDFGLPAGGRVLTEAIEGQEPAWQEEMLSASRGDYAQTVRCLRLGRSIYIDEGWVCRLHRPAPRVVARVRSRMSLLVLDRVSRRYRARRGLLRADKIVHAVDEVSLAVPRAHTLGLVGESGCGKSTTGRLALGMEPPDAGSVSFAGTLLPSAASREWRRYRARMQMVFQDPLGALDRRLDIATQIAEPLRIHRIGTSADRSDRVASLLNAVGLRPDHARRYPHELSGGQRQRVVLARALATSPELLVCDEPVSALDVSIQAQVVNLLTELQAEFGIAMLFISHDLRVVRQVSQEVAVMYLGRIVEQGNPDAIFADPLHPYSRALVSAMPHPGNRRGDRIILSGEPPNPADRPNGCAFHPRCPIAIAACAQQTPPLQRQQDGRLVACLRAT